MDLDPPINNMKISGDRIVQAISDEKVICWSDFLEKLDLLPLFKKYKEENNKQYSINQIFMGKTLLGWIEEILKARIIKSKDKRVKGFKEQRRLSLLGFDALQSMPTTAKRDIDYMELKNL